MDNLPPTRCAFVQHVKRAAYIAGYIWSRSLHLMMCLPSFSDLGFTEDGRPYWTELTDASHGVRKLTKCACKGNSAKN